VQTGQVNGLVNFPFTHSLLAVYWLGKPTPAPSVLLPCEYAAAPVVFKEPGWEGWMDSDEGEGATLEEEEK